ncbi:hypothetical protein NPIL_604591 [Nephila pilipes]|uniref:Uncharacterized protein n=1 Tax=Nephila pilipes TaxID=299642 RepID=A0A8X6I7N2_NEPPI|nr:hypothetical protein NPIL_604591 [Nephila pilipes]
MITLKKRRFLGDHIFCVGSTPNSFDKSKLNHNIHQAVAAKEQVRMCFERRMLWPIIKLKRAHMEAIRQASATKALRMYQKRGGW